MIKKNNKLNLIELDILSMIFRRLQRDSPWIKYSHIDFVQDKFSMAESLAVKLY